VSLGGNKYYYVLQHNGMARIKKCSSHLLLDDIGLEIKRLWREPGHSSPSSVEDEKE
jgi:hypothetical protein